MDLKAYQSYIDDFNLSLKKLNSALFKVGNFNYQDINLPIYAATLGQAKFNILITCGIHGEEQAAPFGLLEFVKSDLVKYLENYSFTIMPINNPVGFVKKQRRGSGNRDLNRYFGKPETYPENQIILDFLKDKTFNHHIDMHEDSSQSKIYIYETGNEHNQQILDLAYQFLDSVQIAGISINKKPKLYGVENHRGVIHAKGGLQKNAQLRKLGALIPHLILSGQSKRGTTLETPMKVPFNKRVQIQRTHLNYWLSNQVY